MYQGPIDVISNKADWIGPFVQLIDDSDSSIINILNVSVGFDCSVYIKDLEPFGCQRVLGSIANGKVIASSGDDGPGFQWSFEASDLSSLCAGTYEFGIKTTTNGEVNDILVGTIAVIEGN
jgi:hypothetical protein